MALLTEFQELNEALKHDREVIRKPQICEADQKPQSVRKTSTIQAPPMCAIYATWAHTMTEKLDHFETRIQSLDCQINNAGSMMDQSKTLIKDTIEEGLQQELMDIENYREWIEELSKKASLELLEMNDGLNLLTMEITNGHGSIGTLLEESSKVFEDTIKSATKK